MRTSSPAQEIKRYLRTGEYDDHYRAWPESGFCDRAERAKIALRRALVAEVERRTKHVAESKAWRNVDVIALARAKVTPMVCGLFPREERKTVLDVLERSVVFLTPSNIATILTQQSWNTSAWTLANLYLGSVGAKLLAKDASRILGMSEATTCYVSIEYFHATERFADYVVHEAAHIFHNCKRRTIGLREIRGREWLLRIDYAKRETFAYACEAYSQILEFGANPAERRSLLEELEQGVMPSKNLVNTKEYVSILREAVAARNGWKRILARCAPPPRLSLREFVRIHAHDVVWPVKGAHSRTCTKEGGNRSQASLSHPSPRNGERK